MVGRDHLYRGEVWWLEDPDLGRRPACILTRDEAIPSLTSVVLAPATTRIRGVPSEVLLGPGDGLPSECVLSFDNILTRSKSLLSSKIAELSDVKMHEVCRTLAFATGC